MTEHTQPPDVPVLDDDLAANSEMFREADRLEEAAYQIIQHDGGNADVLARFTEAKALADAKRAAAQQDWERIRCMLRR